MRRGRQGGALGSRAAIERAQQRASSRATNSQRNEKRPHCDGTSLRKLTFASRAGGRARAEKTLFAVPPGASLGTPQKTWREKRVAIQQRETTK